VNTPNRPISPISGLFKRSGPLAVLAVFFMLGMLWLSLSRLLIYMVRQEQLADLPQLSLLFLTGLRMDSVTLCFLLLLPALLLFLLPQSRLRTGLVGALLMVVTALVVYMEVATLPFMGEYDSRPNRTFFEYLVYPREVFNTLFKDYLLELLLGTATVLLLTYLAYRLFLSLLEHTAGWRYWQQLLVLPVVMLVLLLGARGTLEHRAVNISTAAFSGNRLANELALNSTYSLLYAIYNLKHEMEADRLYGDMPWNEVVDRVQKYTTQPDSAFSDPQIPTLYFQDLAKVDSTPPNLVIFVQESLGARFVGSLGGLPLTPNLDRLSQEGLFFTQLYATGTRTVRGLEAIVTGFPPTPAPSVLKLSLAQKDFFTMAALLKEQGYTSEFIYGGVSNFDNMGGFFLANGFDRVIDQDEFKNPQFLGTWGVSDEDLVVKANETFKAHGKKPFFALMLSTSNHSPFEFPEGRIELYEQPANTRLNAMKYADHAIGKLFELARREEYYKNTIFVVVADHDTRVEGAGLVPIDRFHIPGLIIGPGVPKQRYDGVVSQIDLLPTLLHMMGIESRHPMIGRDLMAVPADMPGRAMMQYGLNNAFRVGDEVVIHQPKGKPATYEYRDGKLHPAPHDTELERDALAHLLWASESYSRLYYRLPDGDHKGRQPVVPGG
jgi:phosphoglycerol transferase MdoB-like AlkP superfamily enzyme